MDASPEELEKKLEELSKGSLSKDPEEAERAQSSYANLAADIRYRESRASDSKAEDSGKDAGRWAVTLRVSSSLFSRLEGLSRHEGRLLQDIFSDAMLREADRLERKSMMDNLHEGRAELIRYRRDRRKLKVLRGG
jgi:hypothetical protein